MKQRKLDDYKELKKLAKYFDKLREKNMKKRRKNKKQG